MNKIMRMSVIVLAAFVHIACSAMMTVDKYMPIDLVARIVHPAPLKTKLNTRATSKECENKIQIPELIEAKKALKGEKIYVLHIRDMIHYGKYKRIGSDEMGWKYLFSPDSNEEPLKQSDSKIYRSILSDLKQEKDNHLVTITEYNKFKRGFALGDKLDDETGKTCLVLANFSDSEYDRKHKFNGSLLFPAMMNNNKQFAKGLIQINPYGFASNPYTIIDMRSISREHLSDYDKARYTARCTALPGYNKEYDVHLKKPRYNSCPMM
jgi:hypothetical protein